MSDSKITDRLDKVIERHLGEPLQAEGYFSGKQGRKFYALVMMDRANFLRATDIVAAKHLQSLLSKLIPPSQSSELMAAMGPQAERIIQPCRLPQEWTKRR